jgi:hypothetical protein
MNSGLFLMDSAESAEKFMEGLVSDILMFMEEITGLRSVCKRFKSLLK